MHHLRFAAALATLATGALAQDKITLANGDVLTGTIKSMADGKVTIASPLLGDVTVPMSTVGNLVTQSQVDLQTKEGVVLKRRIVGIDGGNLRLEGDSPTLALDNLAKINPPPKTEPVWTGSLKLNGLWTEGNTDTRAIGASFDATRRGENDRTSIDASWDYGEDKENDPTAATYQQWTLNQRRAGGGIKYDYFLGKASYLLANARVLADTPADLELRFTAGAGLGYTWVENATTTFVTELGPSYVDESYRSNTPSQDYVAVRAAYKLTYAFSEKTKLVHGVEAYPSTEDAGDIYLTAKTEITTSLTKSMVASIAHVLDYDSTPSVSTTRNFDTLDNRIVLSVGWTF